MRENGRLFADSGGHINLHSDRETISRQPCVEYADKAISPAETRWGDSFGGRHAVGQALPDLRDGFEAAVAEFHVFWESTGEFDAVGDADQQHVLFAAEFQQQVSNVVGRGAIEIARRLVGQ
jgi:hypothetical protein